MSYVTQITTWPVTVVSPDIQHTIATFYELADSKDVNAGLRMANEVFAPNATLIAASGTFRGQEIIKSRDNAWAVVTARRHTIRQVYASDSAGRDLVLLGSVQTAFKNGRDLESPFAAHVVVDGSSHDAGDARLSFMQVFADTAPIAALLKQS